MQLAPWAHMHHFLSVRLSGLENNSLENNSYLRKILRVRRICYLKLHNNIGYYTVKKFVIEHVECVNFSNIQINACHICKFQGGLTANVKLHFSNFDSMFTMFTICHGHQKKVSHVVKTFIQNCYYLPHQRSGEVIELVPSFCLCVCLGL